MNPNSDRKSLTDRFFSRGIFDDVLIFKDTSLAIAWKMHGANFINLSENDFKHHDENLHNLFMTLPDGAQLQFLYFREWKNAVDKSGFRSNDYQLKRLRDFRNNTLRAYMKTDGYIIATFGNTDDSSFRTLPPFREPIVQPLSREKFAHDSASVNKHGKLIEEILEFAQLQRLSNEDIIKLLYRFHNLQAFAGKPLNINPAFFNESLLHNDYSWDATGMNIGEQRLLVSSLIYLPQFITSPMKYDGRFFVNPLFSFLDFDFPVMVSEKFKKIPKEIALRHLKIERAMSSGTFAQLSRKARQKVEQLDGLVDEDGSVVYDGLLEAIELDKDCMLRFSLTVVAWDASVKQLTLKKAEVQNKFKRFGVTGLTENKDALPVFLSCAPGSPHMYRHVRLRAQHWPHFVNTCNFYSGTNQGIAFKNLNDEVVLYDLFADSNDNFNGIIVGPSGKGKTYLAQSIVHKQREQGVRIGIIDKGVEGEGSSYQHLVKLLGGSNIRVSKSQPFNIDPFLCYSPIGLNKDSIEYLERIEVISSFVEVMLLRRNETSLEKDKLGELEKSYHRFFDYVTKNATILDYLDFIKKDGDFFNNDSKFRQYAFDTLEYYLNGKLKRCFDPQNNKRLSLTNNFELICFDLSEIVEEKELLPLFSFILIKSLSIALRMDLQPFILFLDEAWKFLTVSQAMTGFTIDFYRTSRASNGSIIAISQNVEDLRGALAEAIITNSDNKFILQHRQEDMEKAIDIFNFTKAEAEAFKHLKRREVLISSAGEPTILKTHTSEYDHWLYTTKAAEKSRRKKAIEKNGNLIYALSELVEQDEP